MSGIDESKLSPVGLARLREHEAWLAARREEAWRRVELYPRDGDVADVGGHWQALVERGMFGRDGADEPARR